LLWFIKLQPVLFTLYIKRMLYTKLLNCQSNMFTSSEDIWCHFSLISNVSHKYVPIFWVHPLREHGRWRCTK
jgi:hypothetical protein